ncbi:hypothetical protein FQA39_LY10655 [Lamprigera yunnana]|nr:hypothetical protein FQA39_LY10655 [Lamprigera yunnana]
MGTLIQKQKQRQSQKLEKTNSSDVSDTCKIFRTAYYIIAKLDKAYSDHYNLLLLQEVNGAAIPHGEDACKQWKSLRDRYARELKKLFDLKGIGTESQQLEVQTWDLFKNLSFLRNHIEHNKRTVTNYSPNKVSLAQTSDKTSCAESTSSNPLPFAWKKGRAHQWNTAHHLAPATLIVPPAERCQNKKHLKILIPTLWRLLLLLGRCALP